MERARAFAILAHGSKRMARSDNMFDRIKYVLSVDAALIDLGLNPRTFRAAYRQGIQEVGYSEGVTPRATAVFLYHQLPLGLRPIKSDAIIRQWLRDGSVTAEWIRQAERSKNAALMPWELLQAAEDSAAAATTELKAEARAVITMAELPATIRDPWASSVRDDMRGKEDTRGTVGYSVRSAQ